MMFKVNKFARALLWFAIALVFLLVFTFACESSDDDDDSDDDIDFDDDSDDDDANDDTNNDDDANDDANDDSDDDTAPDECGQGLWDFVEDHFTDGDIVIYVRSGYEGEDSDGTKERPYKYISQGINVAFEFEADGVAVTEGYYDEIVHISDISTSRSLRIVGRCPQLTTVETESGDVVQLLNENISLSGFQFIGHGKNVVIVNADHYEIKGNWITGAQSGIQTDGGNGVVHGNEITGFTSIGIYVEGQVDDMTITGNVLSPGESVRPELMGIFADQATNLKIEENAIENTAYGIWTQGDSSINAKGNQFTGILDTAIHCIQTTGSISENSISFGAEKYGKEGFGDGIVVFDSSDISIADNSVESAPRAGIIADSTVGMIERNGLIGNEYGLVIQNGSMIQDDGVNNEFNGNQLDSLIDDARVLDINDEPMSF